MTDPAADPDLERLNRDIAACAALARRRPDPYADGQAYYQELADAQRASGQVRPLMAERDRYIEQAKAERQKIGIARRQLGIDDDTHAAKVERITHGRTRTTLGCSAEERRAILDEYRAAGFRPRPPKSAGRAPSADALAERPLLQKIQALLADQQLPWAYAEAILRRQRGLPAGTACPAAMISATEARGLIAALSRRAALGR